MINDRRSLISRRRRCDHLLIALLLAHTGAIVVRGDDKPNSSKSKSSDNSSTAFELSHPRTYRLKVTIRVEAPRSAIRNVIATGPIPIDWREQRVRLISEKKPPGTRTKNRRLSQQAGMLTFHVASIPRGGSAAVERIYEVTRHRIKFLVDPDRLHIPAKATRQLREFLIAAPGVEIKHAKIIKLAESLKKPENSWATVKSFHDWVRRNVRYQPGEYRGAQFAFEKRTGDCEDMTALFVALCRTSGIPARTVWIEGHAYPEFFLEDPKDVKGYWIPAQLTGFNWFGEMAEYRPILQKGDRVFNPIRRRYTRYVPQSVRASGGSARLSCTRTVLPDKPKSP